MCESGLCEGVCVCGRVVCVRVCVWESGLCEGVCVCGRVVCVRMCVTMGKDVCTFVCGGSV